MTNKYSTYDISLKNVKQSLSNMNKFFTEKGIDIPHSVMLDAFSKAMFFKNWNTLKAIAENGSKAEEKLIKLKDLKERNLHTLVFEFKEPVDLEKFEKYFVESLKNSNCNLIDFKILNSLDKREIQIKMNFPKNIQNNITMMFMLLKDLKKNGFSELITVDLIRESILKESLTASIGMF